MNHTKVAEHWVEGLSAKGSRMYSDGLAVYSYGQHFPIAIWLDRSRRHLAFCDDHYSNSTCKHQGHVRSALRGHYADMVICTQDGMQRILRQRSCNPDKDVVVVKDIEFQTSYDPMER